MNSRASIQFHPDADRRDHDRSYALFSESLDIVKKAWTEDAFTYSGEFYRFPEPGWIEPSTSTRDTRFHSPDGELIALGVHPKPYQKPHPPMWQMGDSIPSHRFAASRGMGNICLALSYEKIREAWGIYNEVSLETEGQDLQPGEKLAVMRPTYIAETYEEAVNDVRDGFNMFGEWAKHDPRKVRTRMAFEHELTEEDYNLSYFDFNLKHDLILVGSPESVREQIEELISETGCRHLALFLNFPGPHLQTGHAQPRPLRLRSHSPLQLVLLLSPCPSTELEADACANAQASASVHPSPSPFMALRERGTKGERVPPQTCRLNRHPETPRRDPYLRVQWLLP